MYHDMICMCRPRQGGEGKPCQEMRDGFSSPMAMVNRSKSLDQVSSGLEQLTTAMTVPIASKDNSSVIK